MLTCTRINVLSVQIYDKEVFYTLGKVLLNRFVDQIMRYLPLLYEIIRYWLRNQLIFTI